MTFFLTILNKNEEKKIILVFEGLHFYTSKFMEEEQSKNSDLKRDKRLMSKVQDLLNFCS